MQIKRLVGIVLLSLVLFSLVVIAPNDEPVFDVDTPVDFATEYSPGTTEGILDLFQSDPEQGMELLASQPELVHSDPALREVVKDHVVNPLTPCDDSTCHTVRGELFGGLTPEENGDTISESLETKASFGNHVDVEYDVDIEIGDTDVAEYDRDEGTVEFENGPTIQLDDFKRTKGVIRVRATTEGSISIEEPVAEPVEERSADAEQERTEEERITTTTFTGEMEISRDLGLQGYFVSVDDASVILPFGGYGSVSVRRSDESTIAIDGQVDRAQCLTSEGTIFVDNRGGTFEFDVDGNVQAEDARAEFVRPGITSPHEEHTVVVDGRFSKEGTDFTITPLDGRETTLTSIRSDDAVTVQSRGAPVEVHTRSENPVSPYVTGTQGIEAPVSEGARVWISDDGTHVSAQGQVNVHEETVVNGIPVGTSTSQPSFTGLDKSAQYHSEKDVLGRHKFVIQGAARYEDYTKTVETSPHAIVEQTVSTGSRTAEQIHVSCVNCQPGEEAATVGMKFAGGSVFEEQLFMNPLTGEEEMFYTVTPEKEQDATLHITYSVADDGILSPEIPADELGRIALQDQLVRRTDVAISAGNGMITFQDGKIGTYQDVDGEIVFTPVTFDLGIRDVIGGKVFVLNDMQQRAVTDFMETYQQNFYGDSVEEIQQFAQQFDPEVQAAIKEATGIDISLMASDTAYTNHIVQGARTVQRDLPLLRARLEQQGYMFDESGFCYYPSDCYDRLEEHKEFNEEAYSTYLQLLDKTKEAQKQFLAAGRRSAEEALEDTSGYDESLVVLQSEQQILERDIDERAVARVMTGQYTDDEKEILLRAASLGTEVEELRKDLARVEQKWHEAVQKRRVVEDAARLGIGISSDDLQGDPEYLAMVQQEKQLRKEIRLLRELQQKTEADAEIFLTGMHGLAITPDVYTAVGRKQSYTSLEGVRHVDDKAVAAGLKVQQLQQLQQAGFAVDDDTMEQAKGRTAWALTDAGRYQDAQQVVLGVDRSVPGVAYAQDMYKATVGGGIAVEEAKADRASRVVDAQWKQQREDEDGLYYKIMREVGAVGLVGVGASVHNLFADDDILIPKEAGEGLLVAPTAKIAEWTLKLTFGETEHERLDRVIDHNQEMLAEIEQTRQELAAGRSFTELTPNVYSRSAAFRCSSQGVDCQRAQFDALHETALYEADGASQVFESMQHLASLGNADARAWVDENTAAVAWERAKHGVYMGVDIGTGLALLTDAQLASKVSQVTAALKPASVSKLSKLRALDQALEVGDLTAFSQTARGSLVGVKTQGKVRQLVLSVGSRIAPEGSFLQRVATKTGEVLNSPLIPRSRPTFEQVIAAERAAETAALQESILHRLATASSRATTVEDVAAVDRALATIGLTEDTVTVAAARALQISGATKAAATSKIRSLTGWSDELAELERNPFGLAKSDVARADEVFDTFVPGQTLEIETLVTPEIPFTDSVAPLNTPKPPLTRQQAREATQPVTDALKESGVQPVGSGSISIADEMIPLGFEASDIDYIIPSSKIDDADTILTKLDEQGAITYDDPLKYQRKTVGGVTYGSSSKGSFVLPDGQRIDVIGGFAYEVDDSWVIARGYTVEGNSLQIEGFTLPVERIPDSSGAIRYRVMAFDLDSEGNPLIKGFFKDDAEFGLPVMTDDALRIKYIFEQRYDRLDLLDQIRHGSERNRYLAVGHHFDYARSGLSPKKFVEAHGPGRYDLDNLVMDQDTGQLFFVTDKGVQENQLGSSLGTFLHERSSPTVRGQLRYPEMRKTDFGEGPVVLSEYAEGSRDLQKFGTFGPEIDLELYLLVDTETGISATTENIWMRNWDFKAEHMLVDPNTGQVTVIDLEKAFGSDVDNLFVGKDISTISKADIDKEVLQTLAGRLNPYYTSSIDEYRDSIQVIESLTDADYAQIRQMALESGYSPAEAERIVLELQENAKIIRQDVQTVLNEAQQRQYAIAE